MLLFVTTICMNPILTSILLLMSLFYKCGCCKTALSSKNMKRVLGAEQVFLAAGVVAMFAKDYKKNPELVPEYLVSALS